MYEQEYELVIGGFMFLNDVLLCFLLEKLREEGRDKDTPSEYPADDCSEKTRKFPLLLCSEDQGEVDGCRHWYCQTSIVKNILVVATVNLSSMKCNVSPVKIIIAVVVRLKTLPNILFFNNLRLKIF